MGDDEIQTIAVKKGGVERARGISFGQRLCDWKLFDALVRFVEDHPKEFETWKKKLLPKKSR